MNKKAAIKQKSKHLVSEPTLKRLPTYLHHLQNELKLGKINISAPKMAQQLELDPTQIVKDLSVTGIKGKPKVGYNIAELISTIEEYLGFNKNNEAFLVGAGKLGQAILSYHELQGFGIHIIAAFDIDLSKVETQYGATRILHMNKLGDLAKRLGVNIGILTTPGNVAQATAEAMVASGITAIWNLTPIRLKLPKNIVVQDTSMYANVAVLLKRHHDSNSKITSE